MVCGHGVNERWFLDILWCSEEFSEKKHGFSFLTTQPVQSSHWCIHLAASKLDQVLRIVWQHFFQGVSQITTVVCPSGIFLGMQGMDPKLKTLRVMVSWCVRFGKWLIPCTHCVKIKILNEMFPPTSTTTKIGCVFYHALPLCALNFFLIISYICRLL